MKKFLALGMVLLFAFSAPVIASDFDNWLKGKGIDWVEDKENIITFSFSWNTIYAHYETKLTNKNGLGINAHLGWYGTSYWGWTTFGVGAEYNWYFQGGHALNGLFAGPAAYLQLVSYSYDDFYFSSYYEDATTFSLGIGGQAGYRWIWENGLTASIKLGLYLNLGGSTEYTDFDVFAPRPGGAIGYAW